MSDNRMKEITGNLKRDVKDLLGESASLVTGVFKRGACTVRVMAEKWKAFAHDITGAVDTLMKPAFAENGPEAPAQSLDPMAEPSVTVRESIDGHFPVGLKLPLSQANELVGRVSREYMEAEYTIQPVTVQIDYMKDGQTDRYVLPLQIGGGGDLLEQMQERVESYRADPEKVASLFESVPEAHREELRGVFTPAIQGSLNDLSAGVLSHFRRHCDISALEQQFQAQAAVLPEKQRQTFQETAGETVSALRRAANTGVPQERPAPNRGGAEQPQREGGPRPRQPVSVQLRQIKEAQAAARKVRLRPHQKGR